MMKNRKLLLAKILLAGFSMLVTLIILELAYRFVIFGPASLSITNMNSFHRVGYSHLVQPADCSETIYELVPNLDELFKLVPFQTNSQGLRDQEYPLDKPANTFRIAIIGDSLVMGTGVAIEDMFHSRVEAELNERSTGVNYELISFGVSGYGLRQYLGVLNCHAKAYDPDLVLVGFYPENDNEILPEEFFEQPYELKGTDYPFFFPFALRDTAGIAKYKAIGWGLAAIGKLPDHPTPEESAYMQDIFDSFGAYSREAGVPVVAGYLTYRTDHSTQPAELEAVTAPAGLCFLDFSAAFAGEDPSQYPIFLIDDHPNSAANEKFAETLLAYLDETGLLNGGSCTP